MQITSPEGKRELSFEIAHGAYRATSTGAWRFKRLNTIELKAQSKEVSYPDDCSGYAQINGKESTVYLHLGIARLSALRSTEKSVVIDIASSQADPPLVQLKFERTSFRWQGDCRVVWRRNDAGAVEFAVEAAFIGPGEQRLKLALQAAPSHFQPPDPTDWSLTVTKSAEEVEAFMGRAAPGRSWGRSPKNRKVTIGHRPGAYGYASGMLADRDFDAHFVADPDPDLDLGDNPCLTDDVFKYLKRYTHFRTLCIERTAIDGRGFHRLAHWPALTRLRAWASHVNDAGVAALRDCRALESIGLNGCPLTDRCYEDLRVLCASLPHLKELYISNTAISDSCQRELAREFPAVNRSYSRA